MSENKKPIDDIIKTMQSVVKSPSINLENLVDNKCPKPSDFIPPEVLDLSDIEPRTLEDDPAFSELLMSFKSEIEENRKSSNRTFIIALLSLIVGIISLTWAIISFVIEHLPFFPF